MMWLCKSSLTAANFFFAAVSVRPPLWCRLKYLQNLANIPGSQRVNPIESGDPLTLPYG